MGNRLRLAIAILAAFGLFLTGCYKEEHFDMPGTAEVVDHTKDYTVPDPFDGSNVVYLIKDGVADFKNMSVMGFTDFAVETPADQDTLSWSQKKDRDGNLYFGCRQHKINYALENTDNYGGNQLSYMYNALYSRLYLKNGPGKQWKVKARMALEVFGCNAFSRFAFEGKSAWSIQTNLGFDWTSGITPCLYLYQNNSVLWNLDGTANYINMADYISPYQPFEIEICCVDNFFYIRSGEKVLWTYTVENATDYLYPLIFYPWKGAVHFYDLSIEGDYVAQEAVAVQRENNYVNIQAPALASSGNDILLFAEGRREVTIQTSSLTSVRSNATDIIVKRSSDEGKTWTNWTVLKGDGGVYMRPEVIQAGDKLYLFYTVDADGKQTGNYRIEYLVSADGGQSWSQAAAVNAVLDGYIVSTLSGHGIKTSDGELVLPLQCRFGNRGTVAALYSKDNGANWQLSEVVPGLRNNSANIIEVEGKLIMYINHSTSGVSRKISTSLDGGATWSELEDATIPTGPGGFQTGGATVVGTDGTIYHFTPINAEKTSSFSGSSLSDNPDMIKSMKRLYIYHPGMELLGNGVTMTVSRNGGKDWGVARDLTNVVSYEGYLFPTGAMDAVISGNSVVLVTEGGVAVPYEGLLIYRESVN